MRFSARLLTSVQRRSLSADLEDGRILSYPYFQSNLCEHWPHFIDETVIFCYIFESESTKEMLFSLPAEFMIE
jgi:hypothetical protein